MEFRHGIMRLFDNYLNVEWLRGLLVEEAFLHAGL